MKYAPPTFLHEDRAQQHIISFVPNSKDAINDILRKNAELYARLSDARKLFPGTPDAQLEDKLSLIREFLVSMARGWYLDTYKVDPKSNYPSANLATELVGGVFNFLATLNQDGPVITTNDIGKLVQLPWSNLPWIFNDFWTWMSQVGRFWQKDQWKRLEQGLKEAGVKPAASDVKIAWTSQNAASKLQATGPGGTKWSGPEFRKFPWKTNWVDVPVDLFPSKLKRTNPQGGPDLYTFQNDNGNWATSPDTIVVNTFLSMGKAPPATYVDAAKASTSFPSNNPPSDIKTGGGLTYNFPGFGVDPGQSKPPVLTGQGPNLGNLPIGGAGSGGALGGGSLGGLGGGGLGGLGGLGGAGLGGALGGGGSGGGQGGAGSGGASQCPDGFSLISGDCIFDNVGNPCTRVDGSGGIYDVKGKCDCPGGYTEKNGECYPSNYGQDCSLANGAPGTINKLGVCIPKDTGTGTGTGTGGGGSSDTGGDQAGCIAPNSYDPELGCLTPQQLVQLAKDTATCESNGGTYNRKTKACEQKNGNGQMIDCQPPNMIDPDRGDCVSLEQMKQRGQAALDCHNSGKYYCAKTGECSTNPDACGGEGISGGSDDSSSGSSYLPWVIGAVVFGGLGFGAYTYRDKLGLTGQKRASNPVGGCGCSIPAKPMKNPLNSDAKVLADKVMNLVDHGRSNEAQQLLNDAIRSWEVDDINDILLELSVHRLDEQTMLLVLRLTKPLADSLERRAQFADDVEHELAEDHGEHQAHALLRQVL